MNKTGNFTVERLSLEGDGVARAEGKVAFIAYTAPGDVVEGRLVDDKKNFGRWIPLRFERTSPQRVAPRCAHYFQSSRAGNWCGGCDWQHIDTTGQRRAKRDLVIETLQRLGGIENPPVHETLSTGDGWRYRNKVQVPFAGRRRQIRAGFYSPGTHQIVEFQDCVVQPEPSVRIVHAVKALAALLQWEPYDEDSHRGWLRHLLVRTNQQGQAMVVLVSKQASFPDRSRFIHALREACPFVIGIFQNVQPAKSHVIIGREWIHLWGQQALREDMNGLTLQYHPASFFQINTPAAEKLYQQAIYDLSLQTQDTVIDLFCGVGAMTLLAARVARKAFGVELAASSIRDAGINASLNNVHNVEFFEMFAEDFFRRHGALLHTGPLKVLLDPPRSGCDPRLLSSLIHVKPKRIVYVSCNPATLARDVKILSPHYQLVSVTPVDLFSQTSHIESVARLDLKA